MKKIIALSSLLVSLFFLTGCGQKETSQKEVSTQPLASSNESKSSASNVVDTKEGYLKAKELVKDQNNLSLKSIVIDNYTPDFQNKIQYVFANNKVTIATIYSLSTKEVSILEKADLTPEILKANQFLNMEYPAIPDSVTNFGLEKVLEAVNNNDEFKKWKTLYPEEFEKYICMTTYDEKYGWEWKVAFSQGEGKDRKSIRFAVKPETGQTVVLSNGFSN